MPQPAAPHQQHQPCRCQHRTLPRSTPDHLTRETDEVVPRGLENAAPKRPPAQPLRRPARPTPPRQLENAPQNSWAAMRPPPEPTQGFAEETYSRAWRVPWLSSRSRQRAHPRLRFGALSREPSSRDGFHPDAHSGGRGLKARSSNTAAIQEQQLPPPCCPAVRAILGRAHPLLRWVAGCAHQRLRSR
jgi:hypothetical protein